MTAWVDQCEDELARIALDVHASSDSVGGDDILPSVIGRFRAVALSASNVARSINLFADRLEAVHSSGGRATFGFRTALNQFTRALPQHVVWWPNGIPEGQRVGIASSRIGRHPEDLECWFDGLRTACSAIDPEREVLLIVSGTSVAMYAGRCAKLFGIRVLDIDTSKCSRRYPVVRWLSNILSRAEVAICDNEHQAHVSPSLIARETGVDVPPAGSSLPLADRLLFDTSERLVVLQVRSGGAIDQLVARRLADPGHPPGSLYLALSNGLVPPDRVDAWMDQGAVGWIVAPQMRCSVQSQPPEFTGDVAIDGVNSAKRSWRTLPGATIDVPDPGDWSYLTHCTRRCDGAWPGQAQQDYVDDLLLQRPGTQRSCCDTLARIVEQGRLIATSDGIRGGHPVVSFTATTLAELDRMRIFRAHRGRWDFEPYGICVRSVWLQKQGARPVFYGDDALWDDLTDGDRPFFQNWGKGAAGRLDGGELAVDWTVEQEWRHEGDVQLGSVPSDSAFLFVPTEQEASRLSRISAWPVVVWPGATESS